MELKGRRIAITGALSGIGQATAIACASAGAAVALAARREDRLHEVAATIAAAGGSAFIRRTDVTVEDEARGFVRSAADELGGVDGLVNNAGVMLLGPVLDAPTDEWRRMIEVNLLGLLYCTHAALPLLLSSGASDIVNVS